MKYEMAGLAHRGNFKEEDQRSTALGGYDDQAIRLTNLLLACTRILAVRQMNDRSDSVDGKHTSVGQTRSGLLRGLFRILPNRVIELGTQVEI